MLADLPEAHFLPASERPVWTVRARGDGSVAFVAIMSRILPCIGGNIRNFIMSSV